MTCITLEVCVDSIASLNAAVAGKADRIELCSALELGGLTPAASLIGAGAQCGVPAYAMIRPRAGGFVYCAEELDLMADDIRICAKAGLSGVVFGAARSDTLDITALEKLRSAAGTMGVTLHRVFDTLSDPLSAIETAADIGIRRILTSGRATAADRSIERIRRYVDFAGDRLAIMAGSGIGPDNAAKIVRLTGVREIHGTFGQFDNRSDPVAEELGFAPGRRKTTDAGTIRQVRRSLERL